MTTGDNNNHRPSETELRQRIIGLGERSGRKSYFPELRRRLEDLETFRLLLDSTNDGIFLLQMPTGTLIDASTAALQMAALTSADLKQASIASLLDPPVWQALVAASGTAAVVTPRQVMLTELRTAGRPPLAVEIAFNAHRMHSITYGVLVVRDITERRQAAAAIAERETKLRALLDHTSILLGLLTLDGVLVAVNGAALAFAGTSETEVLGRSFWETVWWQHSIPLQEQVQRGVRAAALGNPFGFEATHENCHGELRTIDFSMKPVCAADGTVISILAEGFDITEQRVMERRLNESEELFRRLFEQSSEANLLIDGDHFVECNDATVKLLRAACKEEVLSRRPAELSPEFQPDGRRSDEKAAEMLASALKNGGHHFEWVHRCFDGTDLPVDVMLTAVTIHGRPILHTSLRDITARKHAEEQLRQAQKMEAVGHLAGGVAHDFNNLLTPILGYTEILLLDLHPADPRHEPVTQIAMAAERARELTQQLLTFSRKQTLKLDVCHLGSIVREMISLLRRAIRENIDIRADIEDDTLPVRADVGRIDQIVMNLAVNAQDAMPDGGTLTFRVATVPWPQTPDNTTGGERTANDPPAFGIELAVSDTGVGMSDEVRQRIFEPFFTTKAKQHGTGLGLATVYGIIHQHGGHIAVDSASGRGTTFRITLPAVDLSATDAAEPSAPAVHAARGHGELILVLEDEDMVRTMAGRILERFGYRVIARSSVADLLATGLPADDRPALVLCDVIMPAINGPNACAMLRARWPDLRVLFMSGYPSTILSQHGLGDSADDYLQKPFSVRTLLERVRAELDRP